MRTAAVAILALLLAPSAPAAGRNDDFATQSPEQLTKNIENQHPAACYVLAQKLFAAGEKDEAIFWFYAGQLRFRFHLAASPDLDPSGDPALFVSLNEVIGRPINEYAFGGQKTLVATLDRVLAWDEKTENGFTSKRDHAAPWKRIRDGLDEMRRYVVENGDSIRAQRKANGLENRD